MRVFLSYAREDLALGERMAQALGERGIDVLWDRHLSPSLEYSEQIREMIRAADSFAILLTPFSVSSSECGAEMTYAIGLGKRLLPVLGDADVDAERLPDAVRRTQWCLWTGTDDPATAVAQIEEALRTNIELVPMHTRLLNRVDEWRTRDRDRGLLLRDPFLKEAEDWLMRAALKDQLPQPTDLQREYLSVSRAAEIRNNVTFRKKAVAGIAVLVSAVVIISVLYLEADRNEKEANRQKALAEANAAMANRQKATAEANASEANRQKTIAQTQTVLARTNEDLANHRNRTLLEERGRQELLAGRWEAAAVLLGEAYRMGNDAAALRLMLGQAMRPLNGLRATLSAGDSVITCAALSADGKRLILGGVDGIATVWDVETARLVARLPSRDAALDEVHLNADGSRALVVFTSGSDDIADEGRHYVLHTVSGVVWDVDRDVAIEESLTLGDDTLVGTAHPWVHVLADGQHFVFLDGRHFRFADGEPVLADRVATSVPPAVRTGADVLVASADGSTVVAPGPGNSVLLFTRGARRTPLLAAAPLENAQIAFRGASSDLVALNAAGTIHRIFAKDNRVSTERSLPAGTALELSPDGDSAVVIRDGTAVPVNLTTGLPGEPWDDTLGARFSLDGRVVLAWSKMRDFSFTFRTLYTPSFESGTGAKALSNYDQGIAAVSSRGVVAFTDMKITQVWSRFSETFAAVAEPVLAEFSRDGTHLAVALEDGSIIVRDVRVVHGRELRLHADGNRASHLDFSTDSRWLAVAGGGVARIWALTSGELVTTCRGHSGSVGTVRFSGDGTLLATAGSDGTARVWELPSCRELVRFGGHDGGVRAVVFDANATRLATADRRTVRVWELMRETRTRQTIAGLAARLSPACLDEGAVGRWTVPMPGRARGRCAAR